MAVKNLEFLLNPKRIAVIGANEADNDLGNCIFKNLIGQGFKGTVYPVSPGTEAIQGVEAYERITDIEKDIDLAVLASHPRELLDKLRECGEKGVRGVVMLCPDFKNRTPNSQMVETKIRGMAQEYGFRILGPDTLGYMKPGKGLNASLFPKMPPKGNIAFISQSATLSTALLDRAVSKNVGMSYFVSLGMMVDVDFADLIDFLGVDAETRAIILYIESIMSGRKFMTAVRSFACSKPIVVVKSGKFEASAHVALTHSGFMAGEDKVYDAAFKRAGAVRVDEMLDLFYLAETLSKQRRPKGRRLAVITNSGGPAVIAVDTLLKMEGDLASFSRETEDRLKESLPKIKQIQNPLDLLYDATPNDYEAALKSCIQDKGVDGVLVIYTPLFSSSPRETAESIIGVAKAHSYKPILTTWMGDEQVRTSRELLNGRGIPTFVTPEQAVRSFIYMYRYDYNLGLLLETPEALLKDFVPDYAGAEAVIRKAAAEKRLILNLYEVKEILQAYGIPVIPTLRVDSEDEAVLRAEDLGYPVVLKIDSQRIFHKLEKGGVLLNLRDASAVREGFRKLRDLAVATEDPAALVLIQPMIIAKGYELVLGAKKDMTFGSVIVFGTGGELLEAIEDYAIGLPPLNQALAKKMMRETRIYRHLTSLPAFSDSLRYLEEIQVRFSQLIIDFPYIKELDINPFYVTEREGFVLDASVLLEADVLDGLVSFRSDYCPPHLSICPYPVHFVGSFNLNDGTHVKVRPIRPEDEPLVKELLRTSSEQTIRLRFFQGVSDIPQDWLLRYCQIDYDRELAFVGTISEGDTERIIGEVRLSKQSDLESGEMAIVVGDAWQAQGVGKKLCEHCVEVAKEFGIRRIYMEILKENSRMIRRAEKLGFRVVRSDEDNVKVLLDLK